MTNKQEAEVRGARLTKKRAKDGAASFVGEAKVGPAPVHLFFRAERRQVSAGRNRVHRENALILCWECGTGRGPFGSAQDDKKGVTYGAAKAAPLQDKIKT